MCVGITVPQLRKKPRLKTDDGAPDVFVVYYPESDKHNNNVRKFVKQLRKEGIDATCDMFESQENNDRGFYMYSKLVEAEYVFVVCSETFYQYSIQYSSQTKDSKFIKIMLVVSEFY